MNLPASTPRVLVIDDDELMSELIVTALSKAKMQCMTARDGGEGLTKAQKERPDLIIIDRSMPIMSGVQCVQKLNKNPLTLNIPVVMLTGSVGAEEVAESLALGVDDYIAKPFAVDDLIVRCQRILAGFSRTKKKRPARKW